MYQKCLAAGLRPDPLGKLIALDLRGRGTDGGRERDRKGMRMRGEEGDSGRTLWTGGEGKRQGEGAGRERENEGGKSCPHSHF